MHRLPMPRATAVLFAIVVNTALSGTALAHVKWFCAFNVAAQPRTLTEVICPDFALLSGVAVFALMIGCLIEGTAFGALIMRSMDRATGFLHDNIELVFRAGCGFFFVAIWADRRLHTDAGTEDELDGYRRNSAWHSRGRPFTSHDAAIGARHRRSVCNRRLAIRCLSSADYPVFLGVAGYLVLTGLQRDLFGIRALDVTRWSAGVTLMWASIEKWAYPQWSFPLLVGAPDTDAGPRPRVFHACRRAVEFALAFGLMWTPLVRRFAAVMLTAMFVSAVFDFGKIDLIGHSLIVVVLLAAVVEKDGKSAWTRYPWLVPVGYASALALFIGVYYVAHALLFGSSIV